MPFKNPVTRLSQLIADRLNAKASSGAAVVIDPTAYNTLGTGIQIIPQGEPAGLVVGFPVNLTKPVRGGTQLRIIGKGNDLTGGTYQATLTVDPFGASGIDGPWTFAAGSAIDGMAFGTSSVTFDASGLAVIPHSLGQTPAFANAGCAIRSRVVRVANTDASGITVALGDSSGAAVAGETRTIRWLAIA